MAFPSTFMASGTVPQIRDTKRILWLKKLATIQGNQLAPFTNNNPAFSDTTWRLKAKAASAAMGRDIAETICCGGAPAPVNDPVFDTLTHYWRGNEAAGSPRADSKGSIDLVESGGSVNSASGIDGNCASISSSNFLDSVVDVFPGINLPSSLMLWFKAPLLASLDLWKSDANDGSPFATLSANQMVPGNSGDGGGLLDYNYTANTWHLVVLTSTAGGVQSCSFDGAPVALSDDQVPQSFTGSCGIGQNWAAGTVLIGEVGVFNVALTSAECATLWNGGVGKFYRP